MAELLFTADDWPELVWVEPETNGNGGFQAIVTADRFDMSCLDWRQRALLRASAQRVLDRLDKLDGGDRG